MTHLVKTRTKQDRLAFKVYEKVKAFYLKASRGKSWNSPLREKNYVTSDGDV